jgi:3-oxoacyl-[acyl-carrier-protein] synthase-3
LLRNRGIEASEIELIIFVTVTPDMFFPASACIVQDKIGAKGAWGFDLSAACSGFLYGLTVGAQFIESGAHKKVMVVGADVMTSILDPKDRSTLVLFGDGAGAILLEPSDDDGIGVLDYLHEVDGSGGPSLCMPGGGSLNPPSHETVDKRNALRSSAGSCRFQVCGAEDGGTKSQPP